MIPKPTDDKIQQDVASELARDTRISPTEIGVAVKNGVVTLSGSVDTFLWRPAVPKSSRSRGGSRAPGAGLLRLRRAGACTVISTAIHHPVQFPIRSLGESDIHWRSPSTRMASSRLRFWISWATFASLPTISTVLGSRPRRISIPFM